MRFVLCLMVLTSVTSAFAVENCFTAPDVVRGQFLVGVKDDATYTSRYNLENAITDLGLSITVSSQSLMYVEKASATVLSKAQENEIIEGLTQIETTSPALSFIECNGIVSAN